MMEKTNVIVAYRVLRITGPFVKQTVPVVLQLHNNTCLQKRNSFHGPLDQYMKNQYQAIPVNVIEDIKMTNGSILSKETVCYIAINII